MLRPQPFDLVGNRLVRQLPELLAHPSLVGQDLDHEHADHFFLRIDPEFGPRSTTPIKRSRRTKVAGLANVLKHTESESER